MKKFYITTPLYYVNAAPHIGHSYTNIAADCLARFMRLKGRRVFFLTGTDEHGQKIARAAEEADQPPQEFVDRIAPRFVELWKILAISYDDFIRTTQQRHTQTVQAVLKLLYEKGDIYQADYVGFYCTPCETFWPKTQLERAVCPDCNRALEELKEKNFFLRLSKYQQWLIAYIKKHPDFIKPLSRRNEILSFLEKPLNDLCISRPRSRLKWGIPIPFSPQHVTYVWFDALINYISAVGFAQEEKRFVSLWPAELHLVGKDILRQHAIYWPIILYAVGLVPPKSIFAHGWWLIGESKMSKSRGNIVDPTQVVRRYGQDAYRYFLLREIPFGQDGTFTEQALINRINSDLANDLGNLFHRSLTMVEKYFSGKIPQIFPPAEVFKEKISVLLSQIPPAMDKLNFQEALNLIWELINLANKFIEEAKPWELNKAKKIEKLASLIYNLIEVLRIVAICIYPFIPNCAKIMWDRLGKEEPIEEIKFDKIAEWGLSKPGRLVRKGKPLFPRINQT